MPLFAFLYRSTRPLTDIELAERSRVVPPWALAQREAGRVVAVCVFDDEAAVLAPDDARGETTDSSLVGCTLVNALDMDDALQLARQFPGRAFGTEVQVRPVKTFVAPPAQSQG